MKILKKSLKIAGITLLSLILLAFIVPVVFKKQIQALVKKEINKNLDARVDFSDVKLSLFRHFPRAGIVIKDLIIIGKDEFAADTLIAVKKVEASAGLFSVLKGKDIKVSGLRFESPRIHALMNKDGKANWDIARSSTDTSVADTSASSFKLTLKKYEINDGYVLYRDEKAGTYAELNNLDHKGSGNLTEDVFTLVTSTRSESASFTQDGIPYLVNTKTAIDAAIKIDNNTQTFTFETDDILLNNLKLSTGGFVQVKSAKEILLDIKFKSPSNDFKDILSMIPAIYKKDFDNIQSSGKAIFNGFVKGSVTPERMPSYDVNLEVKDGSFKYPDLPKPVKNIQLILKASNVDGLPDNAVIDIPKGHLEMDNEPFDFRFVYKKPMTTRLIDAAAKGKIDLSQLSKFIKLEKETKLSGLVWADAFVKGPMKALEQQQGAFTAGGFFDIKNLYYAASNFPQPIKNGNIRATLQNSGGIADNTVINVSSGHVEVGNDPLDFNLQLSKPVSLVNFSGHAKGRFTLDNLKQFVKLDPGTSVSGVLNTDLGFAGNKTAINQKQYDKITLDGTAALANLKYSSPAYPTGVNINNTQLVFNPKNVTLSSLSGNYLNTNFNATGVLNNLVGFMMQDGVLTGNLNLNAEKADLNAWMGKPATTADENNDDPTPVNPSSSPFLVPADVSFTINTAASQVKYDKVDYNNVTGVLVISDEKITLKNIKTDVLDGSAVINGSYSTKINKKEPDIGFSYAIKDMDVQKAFQSYNTIQFLMPIGKFLSGKLSSELSLVGNLHSTMMPKLNSLTGNGNLLLLKGVLAKFKPLEKMAAVLQIDRLKSISVKDIKNYVEFANGKVLVKPFNLKIDEIEMVIGGFHGFDQSIDYSVQMKLPRSVMGSGANNMINNLAAEANNKGIPIKLGETVNLSIKLTGTISNPAVGVNLKEMAGSAIDSLKEQVKDFAQARIDSAKQKAKDSLNAVKELLKDKVKDKIKEQVLGKDTTNNQDTTQKQGTGEAIKNKLKGIFKKKPKDSL